MREIEKKILACIEAGKVGTHRLSIRDLVTIHKDGTISYKLWDTELYYKSSRGIEHFYFSSIAADTANCMSATTASRINALLRHTPSSVYRRASKLYDQLGHRVYTDCLYKLVDGLLISPVICPGGSDD